MPLLTVLWLVAVHALASLVAPSPLRGAGDWPSRVAGVRVAGTQQESPRPGARASAEPAAGQRAPRSGDEALRAPAPHRLPAVRRSSDHSARAVRSSGVLTGPTSPALPILSATVSRCVARQVSHAATARGGHLPYFPTAPPLLG